MAQWITAWGQALTDTAQLHPGKKLQTVRAILPLGVSGSQIRLRFGNYAGKKPMHLSSITVQVGNSPILPVLFSGAESVSLPPYGDLYSDPIDLALHKGQDVTISIAAKGLFLSGNTPNEVVQISKPGNYAPCLQMPLARKSIRELLSPMGPVLPALTSVEVFTDEEASAIVCFGDSITRQGHWTNPLRDMLFQAGHPVQLVNKGIGGNRLLRDALPGNPRYGQAGFTRFQRDVLEQPGASAVILALGTNDLGFGDLDGSLKECNADHLAQGFLELTNLAKSAGQKVYAATVTPRCGSENWTEEKEIQRQKLNIWIRGADCFDDIMDFDFVTRDSQSPAMLAPACDSGDHLHPGPMGGKRMAREAFRVLMKT